DRSQGSTRQVLQTESRAYLSVLTTGRTSPTWKPSCTTAPHRSPSARPLRSGFHPDRSSGALNPFSRHELQLHVQRHVRGPLGVGVHAVRKRLHVRALGLDVLTRLDPHAQGGAVVNKIAAVERVVLDRLNTPAG